MRLMKNLKVFLLMFIIGLLFSCKPRELPKEKEVVTITKTITQVQRDTLIKVEADSSFFNALVKCQNGKPFLSPPTKTNAKKEPDKKDSNKGLQKPSATIDENGNLTVRCDYFENLYKVTLKEKQILTDKLNEKTIVPPPLLVEKQLSWWQKLWLTLGKILTASLSIFLILKIPWKALLKP